MQAENKNITLDDAILNCLKYFGIFSYPLTLTEIHRYITVPATIENVDIALYGLAANGEIQSSKDFYTIKNIEERISKRKTGYGKAMGLLERSSSYVKLLARFPFVEGIAISGSLSKYHAKEETDIDYFIITTKGRLWIARSFLHMFKKLSFITGHQHYFCMNYFVDTDALYLTHRNLYSAIELQTLIPVYNLSMILSLLEANPWVSEYLPNAETQLNTDYLISSRRPVTKRISEFILGHLFPKAMNSRLMKITDRKWRHKWRNHGYTADSYNRAFMTTINVSKNHPDDYEDKVLTQLSK